MHNLTAIRDERDVVVRHIFDSLAIADLITNRTVIDVGSGGGLPGIPLAICLPEKHFTLLDINAKKTSFLNQVVIELQLSNVKVVQARVEEFVDSHFDHVLCRAFASLQDIADKMDHLLGEQGNILAMKGKEEALESAATVKVVSVSALDVPLLDADRCVIELRRAG